jgi:hypothetical protein
MRLTLRTLLAYLDDTLDPEEAKNIGHKVAESDTAQELIARIKQVTRRRRLTVPPATGPGSKLDANTIAEYLDNVLTGDQPAELEEVCLNSDVHLAEMAACHQILALVVGEQALVPPTARQRMYGLVQGREAIPYRKPAVPKASRGVPAVKVPVDEDADEALLLGLPLYHRAGTATKWLVPLGALCLLVLAAVAFFMALPSLPHRPAPGNGTDNRVAAVIPIKDSQQPPAVVDKKPEGAEEKQADATPEKKGEDATERKPESVPDRKDEQPIEKKAEPIEKKAEPVEQKKPDAPPEPPRADRKELGKYVTQATAPPSVLLQRVSADAPWQRVRPGSGVMSNEELMSLPGYRSEIRLDNGVSLTLWGNLAEFGGFPVNESVVRLQNTPGFDLDLQLDRGQVVVANRKSEGPARVRVRFLDQSWDLTLQNNATEVSLALFGVPAPYSRDTSAEPPYIRMVLITLGGDAFLKLRTREFALPGMCMFEWDNLGLGSQGPRPLPRLPDWWSGTRVPSTKEGRSQMTALDELSKRLKGNTAVATALAEGFREPDEASRTLAVRCLMAIDDLSRVLDSLDEAKRLDTRLYAILALRHWLGISNDHEKQLRDMLVQQKRYTPGQADIVVQLLRGFTEKDWADPVTRSTVVDYLNHDRLPIRQLAHWLLNSVVPGAAKIKYDAAGDTATRQAGYEQWRKQIGADSRPLARPAPSK